MYITAYVFANWRANRLNVLVHAKGHVETILLTTGKRNVAFMRQPIAVVSGGVHP